MWLLRLLGLGKEPDTGRRHIDPALREEARAAGAAATASVENMRDETVKTLRAVRKDIHATDRVSAAAHSIYVGKEAIKVLRRRGR